MIKKIAVFLSLSLLCFKAVAADSTTKDMMKQIDYLQKKHEVLSTNIANSNTPEYRAKDIESPDFMMGKKRNVKSPRVKLRATNTKHIKPIRTHSDKYKVINDNSGAIKPNKNNVDLAQQVSKVASNNDEVSVALKNYKSSMDLIANAADPGGHR